MSLELPRRLLADRLTVLLIGACAVAIEAALWRHPGLPVGLGFAAAGLLWAWDRRRLRHAPTRAQWGPQGWRLGLADGRWIAAAAGRGTRLLGSSVVLQWQAGGRCCNTWLTPADLPRPVLRALVLRLRTQGSRGAQ